MPQEAAEKMETRVADLPEQGELVADQTPNDSDVQMEGPEDPSTNPSDASTKLCGLLEVLIY